MRSPSNFTRYCVCHRSCCSPDGTTIAKKKDGIFCVRFIILDCTARSHFPPPFSSHCQYGGSKNIYQTSSALVLCWSRTERETAICISSDRFRHNGDINKPRNEQTRTNIMRRGYGVREINHESRGAVRVHRPRPERKKKISKRSLRHA